MTKEKKKETKKVRKALSVTGIVIKILLILAGVALLAFFVWVGLQVALVLGIKGAL